GLEDRPAGPADSTQPAVFTFALVPSRRYLSVQPLAPALSGNHVCCGYDETVHVYGTPGGPPIDKHALVLCAARRITVARGRQPLVGRPEAGFWIVVAVDAVGVGHGLCSPCVEEGKPPAALARVG